jgi:hypothetical protein
VALVGGVALIATLLSRSAPHDQVIVIRLPEKVARVAAVVTREGDLEPSAGFSQDFPNGSPRTVRHEFSAPNDAYIVVITLSDASVGASIPHETSYERRVSLVGGELTISPD